VCHAIMWNCVVWRKRPYNELHANKWNARPQSGGTLPGLSWQRSHVGCDDYPSIWYPLGYPVDFFDVMDARVSKIWKPEVAVSFAGVRGRLRTFEEWANDPSFYERLVDKEDLEITTFRKRKEFMDLEYPCREEFKLLTYFDSRWCQCPSCGNVWEDGVHTLGMKRCPACTEILVDGLWTGYNIPQEVH